MPYRPIKFTITSVIKCISLMIYIEKKNLLPMLLRIELYMSIRCAYFVCIRPYRHETSILCKYRIIAFPNVSAQFICI